MRVRMTLQATDDELVDTCVRHHSDHLEFRRSLRMLTFQEARVRHARAVTRLEAIEEIRAWRGEHVADDARMALDLIQVERLADALAEGEMADMGWTKPRRAPSWPRRSGACARRRRPRWTTCRATPSPWTQPCPPEPSLGRATVLL
jgi:hypothetical protein